MKKKAKEKSRSSISKKLVNKFFVVLSIMILINIASSVINIRIVRQYQSIINNLVLEGQVKTKTEELISVYTEIVRSSDKNKINKKEYDSKWNEIKELTAKLDKSIVYNKSKIDYSVLKKILENINKDCNESFSKINTSSGDNQKEAIYNSIIQKSELAEKNIGKVLVSESEYMKVLGGQIQKIYTISVAASILGLFLLGMFCIVYIIKFSSKIAKQLSQLNLFAKEISNGNLSAQDINFNSNDEIEELGLSFVHMKNSLKSIVEEVQKNSTQIFEASNQLSLSMNESSMVNEGIVTSIISSSEISNKQCELVDAALAEIENSNKEIQDIVTSTRLMQEQSEEAMNYSLKGKSNLENMMNQVSKISNIILDFETQVKVLDKRSSEIENILVLITDISNQTNLLSLNASIEAARAGEHGRGFYVVADEIGKLSSQSSDAVKEISSILSFIKKDTEAIDTKMRLGVLELQENKEASNSVKDAFYSIEKSNEKVNESINNVYSNINFILEKMSEVLNDMNSLKEKSVELSNNNTNNSASMEEQSAAIEEVNSSSEVLREMARNMQEVTKQFII